MNVVSWAGFFDAFAGVLRNCSFGFDLMAIHS